MTTGPDHGCRCDPAWPLTRNQARFAGTAVTVPMLAEPTSTQRQAFDLLGAPIPLTLK